MKTILLTSITGAILTASAYAVSFDYNCYLTTDKDQRLNFSLTESQMFLRDQTKVMSTSPFILKKGVSVYDNQGLVGGRGKMKDRLYYSLNYEQSEVIADLNYGHYYLDQELLEGGRALRNGSYGGYVTFEGHGYSYESYICFRR